MLKSRRQIERNERQVPETAEPEDLTAALSPAGRKALRAQAHHLQPVVMIGEAGLTEQVLREIELHLRRHELIKIRVLGEARAERRALIAAICEATGAQAVQHIGKMLVVYRPRSAEENEPARQPRPRRKAPRRTKRSFQNR